MNITTLPGGLGDLTVGGAGVWTLVAGMVYLLIRLRPVMKKLQIEEDSSLRTDLLKRVTQLETDAALARRECMEEQEKLHQRIREQDKIIDGLQRQIIMFQITVGQALPPDQRSPQIDAMLDQLMKAGLDPVAERAKG